MKELMQELYNAEANLARSERTAAWVFSCCKTSREWQENHKGIRKEVERARQDVEFLTWLIKQTKRASAEDRATEIEF